MLTIFWARCGARSASGILLNAKGERFANELGRRDYLSDAIFAQNVCGQTSPPPSDRWRSPRRSPGPPSFFPPPLSLQEKNRSRQPDDPIVPTNAHIVLNAAAVQKFGQGSFDFYFRTPSDAHHTVARGTGH